MFPSPSELLYFIEVSETLNVSRAAERLGITQPTLSLSIKRLEDYVGTPLLIRSKAGVKLTLAGKGLARHARHLLQEWQHIKNDVMKGEDEISGRYSIGCHPSVALYSLPHFLPKLLHENTGLEISLFHDLSRKIVEGVVTFDIDFGIVVNPVAHPDLVIRPITDDIVTLFVSKDAKTETSILICDPDLIQSQAILKELSKSGLNFTRTLYSSNLEVVTSLVSAGAGIGIIPSRVALRHPEQNLMRVKGKTPEFKDKICLVYRADVQRSKAAKELAKKIELALKEKN